MVLEKGLYGHPAAGRWWSDTRDDFLLKRFKQKGWFIKRATSDPCFFHLIKYGVDRGKDSLVPGESHAWFIIHTDDVDMVGESKEVMKEVNDIIHDKWNTKIVDSDYVLGVKREIAEHPKGLTSTMSMPAFIDQMVFTFQAELSEFKKKHRVSIPFPEGLILSLSDPVREGEHQEFLDKGSQRLTGSLLWAVRHVSPESNYGITQISKLMAKPTEASWNASLNMLAYLELTKNRGIRFCSWIDDVPVAYSDASNKDDRHNGKCHGGHIVSWGGPIVVKSAQLLHVGMNSSYNEYMQIMMCAKHVVWLRQLLAEIGLEFIVDKPTVIYGDNNQANNLCTDNMVTSGNMYYRTCYHYNKELKRDGIIDIQYIKSADNPADGQSKALPRAVLKRHEATVTGHHP